MHGGLFHVRVDQQHVLIFPRHCQCEVDGDGGLALVLQHGGDHDDLAVAAAHLVFHAGAQLFERLDKEEARRWVRNEDAGLLVRERGAERFVLALVVDGGQQLRVQLALDLVLGLDRIPQIGAHAQQHDDQRNAGKPRELRGVQRVGRVDRRGRDARLLQDLQ